MVNDKSERIFSLLFKKFTDVIGRFEVLLFLGWLAAIHIFELITLPSLPTPTQLLAQFSLTERLLEIWVSGGDSAHYMLIAKNGYAAESRTLFPLWPLVIKILGASPATAKIAATGLTLVFLIIFAKFIKKLGQSKSLPEILIAFLVFPSSFLLTAPLSEPLYIVLAVITFILGERKKFVPAAFFAALASGTRPIGIVLTLYLGLKLLQGGFKVLKKYWWTLVVSPSGLVFYALFLQVTLGDFALFYKDQLTGWGRSISFGSLQNLFSEQMIIINQILGPVKPVPINLLHFGLIFFFIFLACISFKRLNKFI